MRLPEDYIRAKHKKEGLSLDQCFLNPIIHREIQGNKVFVPLDLKRIWNQ